MRPLSIIAFSLLCSFFPTASGANEPIIVDHRHTDLPEVPSQWIDAAKNSLHIAYGHTSHGSQVTSGMTGLVTFTGGCGGPQFAWNNGGTGGALDLHDNAMAGDVGYYPQWVDNTKAYLDNPVNSDVNVIIWSWCGQVSGYTQQDMINKYLAPMSQLEIAYPGVTFVYMTGHLSITQKANTDARNQQIRDFCIANDKVLFDFADIESYDPDDVFFDYANDDCSYYTPSLTPLGNWATEWQNAHTQGVDWYKCSSAHSQPLNANLKAYAIWWLWARLAGWEGKPLDTDRMKLSAGAGGSVGFALHAGVTAARRPYFLLGSASGTSPGLLLPGGLTTLPLNQDLLLHLTIAYANTPLFQSFSGTLDATGSAHAVLDSGGTLPPSTIGLQLNFAYLLPNPFDYVSNPVPLEITP